MCWVVKTSVANPDSLHDWNLDPASYANKRLETYRSFPDPPLRVVVKMRIRILVQSMIQIQALITIRVRTAVKTSVADPDSIHDLDPDPGFNHYWLKSGQVRIRVY